MRSILNFIMTTVLVTNFVCPAYAETKHSQLHICVEEEQFPPFNYLQKLSNGKYITVGYDIDLIEQAFTPAGITFQIVAMPWQRCLNAVITGNFDAAMSASLSTQRKQDYLYSAPYYELSPFYFYLKEDFPSGLTISNFAELAQYGEICGIEGFNYQNFGANETDNIIQVSKIIYLPEMLQRKRCATFLARQETLAATLSINQEHSYDKQLIGTPIPNAQAETFHMLISKRSPFAGLMSDIFNKKVSELRDSGQLSKLLQHHLEAVKTAQLTP